MASPNRMNNQSNYKNSRLANYGNQVLDRGPGSYDASTDFNSTNDTTDRRNIYVPQNLGTDRKDTHQVPGMGVGYNHREQEFLLKKQRVQDDLARAYQEQMAEKKRREYEEKRKKEEEERAIEDKVKRELREMALAMQAEAQQMAKNDQSRVQKSFDKLNQEREIDNQGRGIRKKTTNVNKSSFHGSKKELDSHDKADSPMPSGHQSMIREYGDNQHGDREEHNAKSRILNESLLDQQKTTEKAALLTENRLLLAPDSKHKDYYHQQYRAGYYPDGSEMPVSFKTASDERMYRLKKELATRTSMLHEQATTLKVFYQFSSSYKVY